MGIVQLAHVSGSSFFELDRAINTFLNENIRNNPRNRLLYIKVTKDDSSKSVAVNDFLHAHIIYLREHVFEK